MLAALSPYLTQHIKRYRDYVVELGNIPEPLKGAMVLPVEDENPFEYRFQRNVTLFYINLGSTPQ